MDWERIEPELSFHDPLSRLCFRSIGDSSVELTFLDWRDRRLVILFSDVSFFSYGFFPPDVRCTEANFYRKSESPKIEQLRECRLIGMEETAIHYLIGTNEDEWCEVIATSHEVKVIQ